MIVRVILRSLLSVALVGTCATAGEIPSSYFTMTTHDAVKGKQWPTVPIGSIRLWDTFTLWSDLNPSPGVYNWTMLDEWLSLARAHNVDVLYTFGATPAWASSNPKATCDYNPGACYPPSDLQSWDDYVRAIAIHAAGRIKYWELWNEANQSEYWNGNFTTLVTMAHHAYRIIKSIDHQAMILTPSAVGGAVAASNWLGQYFAAGGGSYCDGIAFHGYGNSRPSVAEEVGGIVDAMQGVMFAYGQSAKPLWDTEASWGLAEHLPNEEEQVSFVARHYILQWSKGVQRSYWYAWDDTRYGTLWDKNRGLRKPGIAYREVYRWLAGATMTLPCAMASDSTWTCGLTRPGGYEALLVWNPSSTKWYKPAARFEQYLTLVGETFAIKGPIPIGSQPILLQRQGSLD